MQSAVEFETASSVDDEAIPSLTAADQRGKHRILAELKRLEQENMFLQEELEKLEKMEDVSTVCHEFVHNTETRPDPLLPVTNGPGNPSWDKWFEAPKDSEGCRCCIL